jgi:hypothetical protein
MNCNNCGYPNPNGYLGACKSCRQPLVQEAIQVVETVAKKTKTKKVLTQKVVEEVNGEDK